MGELYEFSQEDAYNFQRHIGIQAKPKGNELQFLYCPYCRGGSSGKDKGTFAISLQTGQFKCLRASCGVSGNMITLAKDFDFSLGNMVDEYFRPKKKFKTIKLPNEIKPKPEAIKYLESRGISAEVANRYSITIQTKDPNFLVMPFLDEKGILQTVKYRKMNFDKTKDKLKEYCEKGTKLILYGMYQCKGFNRLIITEGQLDSLSLIEAGIENAVSVPNGAKGFTWLPYCWDWINQFEEVIVFGDYEKGHITLLDELSRRLKTRVKHVREEDYRGCKDANEILMTYGKDQLHVCVENAVCVPIERVKDLADVVLERDEDVEVLRTNIKEIDKLLGGGLPFGGLTLVSGKAGNGKSTLASQFVAQAIAQGYKAFVYSGELRNSNFKKWLNFQIAGERRTLEYSNRWGDKMYRLSDNNTHLINEWYRDKCYIYDSEDTDYDNELESLTKLIRETIGQYGTRVILIDNLMTALDLEPVEGSDKYDKQGKFVKRLAKMAQNFNVLIILVVHKRKNGFSTDENDEVMGASDIVNLASVVISYGKDKVIDDSQRMCKLTKNRIYGKLLQEGTIMDYNERSKRIYEHLRSETDGFDFNWDISTQETENGIVITSEIMEESPFD